MTLGVIVIVVTISGPGTLNKDAYYRDDCSSTRELEHHSVYRVRVSSISRNLNIFGFVGVAPLDAVLSTPQFPTYCVGIGDVRLGARLATTATHYLPISSSTQSVWLRQPALDPLIKS